MTKNVNNKKIMEGIREYVKKCPALQSYLKTLQADVNVEYLEDESKNYSIESEPIQPVLKRYLDGSAVKQFAFIFSSRESYGREILDNLSNCGFYEEFADWIEQCNRDKEFPNIGDDREVTKIAATTTPYMFDTSETNAKYQIQVVLTYFQKGGN